MVRIDRICVWLFMACFLFMLPGLKYLKFMDELISFSFLAVALVDCIANGNWRYYRLLWIIAAVLTFYMLYSLIFLDYNTPRAIMSDWIIEMKPFIPFAVMYAARPRLTATECFIFKIMAIASSLFLIILSFGGTDAIDYAINHVTYLGAGFFISSMIYLYCSAGNDGEVAPADLIVAMLMLTAGLGCTRAKYYGVYVLAIFFLFIFRPGDNGRLRVRYIIAAAMTVVAVIAISWYKIDYYFISGNTGSLDIRILESYARPVLYLTGGNILIDHIPFGTGLASFGTFMSGEYYSAVYQEYGIHKVYGLSEHMPSFICDTFYPSLAQYGIVGVILFIAFWIFIYSKIKYYLCIDGRSYRFYYAIGMIVIAFIAIESVAATTFTQTTGMQCMLLLGILCGDAQRRVNASHK